MSDTTCCDLPHLLKLQVQVLVVALSMMMLELEVLPVLGLVEKVLAPVLLMARGMEALLAQRLWMMWLEIAEAEERLELLAQCLAWNLAWSLQQGVERM